MNYIILDLEATCGWEGEDRQSEIIEIGAVKLNEKLEVIGVFERFIKPTLNQELTEFCKKLTTIKQSDVDGADMFPVVIQEFKEWIGSDYVLCSWGHYDKRMFRSDCDLWSIDKDWIENRHMSIKHQHGTIVGKQTLFNIYKEIDNLAPGDQTGAYKKYKKEINNAERIIKKGMGMANALLFDGIPAEGTHHRGIDDAKNIAKIFKLYFNRFNFPNQSS